MKSIKPGRGPSKMSFAASIFSIVFGIFWTILAFSITGGMRSAGGMFSIVSLIFPLFGVCFVVLGIVQAVYHYKNANGEERASLFDIMEDGEEGDPYDPRRKEQKNEQEQTQETGKSYCPYCGKKLEDSGFRYCPHCGKTLR